MAWYLIDKSGNYFDLVANGIGVKGSIGTGLPDPENITSRFGIIDGGTFQRAIYSMRQFTLLCDIVTPRLKSNHSIKQKLIDIVPNEEIKVAYRYGEKTLFIDCRYVSGLSILGQREGFSETFALVFLAVNPYWYEDEILSQVISSSVPNTINYIQQNKDLMDGGLDDKVREILRKNDDYRIFGDFTNHAKSWNGTSFSDIADNPRNIVLNAVEYGNKTYAVGNSKVIEFLDENNNFWDCLNISNPVGTINAICVDSSGNVYIGGIITSVSGKTVSNIAKWNGKYWSDVSGGLNGEVKALFAKGTDIYIAGDFTSAGGVTGADYIALWDDTNYNIIGTASAINGVANDIVNDSNSDTYIVGNFSTPTNNIACFNNNTNSWSALINCTAEANCLTLSSLGVFASSLTGTFVFYMTYIFTWETKQETATTWDDIGTWETLPDTIQSSERIAKVSGVLDYTLTNNTISPYGLYATDTALYVGHSTGLSKWESGTYTLLTTTNNPVKTITSIDSDIYFGGSYTHVTGDYVLRYNGGTLYPLVSALDINDTVNKMINSNGRIYLVGDFTSVKSGVMNYLVGYEANHWYSVPYSSIIKTIIFEGLYAFIAGDMGVIKVTLSNGLSEELAGLANVNTLTYKTVLYAGGSFSNYIKSWNGSSWVTVDGGMNGEVYQLGNDGSTVYAIGNFQQAGSEVACGGIARLISGTWINFGTGINTTLYSLRKMQIVSPNEIYIAGNFPEFSGVSLTFPVIKYNGTSWVEYLDDFETTDADVLSLLIEDSISVSTLGYNNIPQVIFFGDIIVYNGSAPSAPQLVLTGVGNVTSFRNTTVDGANIYFDNLTLVAGDVATLDLNPQKISFVKVNYGLTKTDINSKISYNSTPSKFRLKKGNNSIRVLASGTITATVKYQNQHYSIDSAVG